MTVTVHREVWLHEAGESFRSPLTVDGVTVVPTTLNERCWVTDAGVMYVATATGPMIRINGERGWRNRTVTLEPDQRAAFGAWLVGPDLLTAALGEAT